MDKAELFVELTKAALTGYCTNGTKVSEEVCAQAAVKTALLAMEMIIEILEDAEDPDDTQSKE